MADIDEELSKEENQELIDDVLNNNLGERQSTTSYGINQPSFLKDVDIMNEYNRFRINAYENEAQVKGIPYVFFTTPMCNMSEDNVSANSFLSYMATFESETLSLLNYSPVHLSSSNDYKTTSPFIKLLSNTALNFDGKDKMSRTREIGETFTGYKMMLPTTNVDSINGEEFSVRFRDIKDLKVLKLINSWFIYHNGIRTGDLSPTLNAIKNNFLDFTSSVYYFLTDMDGETLQYWSKYTGCFPLNVPFSAFGSEWNNHDIIEYSINFGCSFREEMNPSSLFDFNKVTLGRTRLLNWSEDDDKGNYTMSYLQNPSTEEKLWEGQNIYTSNGRTQALIVLESRDKNVGVDGKPRFKLKFLND